MPCPSKLVRHLCSALILLGAFNSRAAWALASVTGGLNGTVVDAETSAPLTGVQVTAASPSLTETSTTDAAGHFDLRTLTPDTYTITASKNGFQVTSVAGQIVVANTVQVVSLKMAKVLRTIAHVTTTEITHGNGIITPVRSWQKDRQDCYSGRYAYTYPDGATESGNIVWPFCYDQEADPFRQPQRPMPFPPPPAGFRLPAGTQMPPIEKRVYEKWAAANASGSAPP